MRRRQFIGLIAGTIVLPVALHAQSARVYRIGYLGTGAKNTRFFDLFRQTLRELGWIEGQNIIIEQRFAEGQYDKLPDLANELISVKPDVLVASPTPATQALRNLTETIPIVAIGFDNPVQHGLVASLARPGGNVTGLSYAVGPEIFGKDLEFLKELVPALKTVAVLSNPTNTNHAIIAENVTVAAGTLGIKLVRVGVKHPDGFDGAFAVFVEHHADALFMVGDPMFGIHQAYLTDLSIRHSLPSMHTNRQHVEAGGLMSYGPSFSDLWRRAASYVDKILKGARPVDLPVEQPTKFEFVINLKTAKALGLQLPPRCSPVPMR